ncbi:ATP-dependent RNA helicase, mitochondrial [Phlyctema vagabunda]|uniref:ATP-dependent RNA helicase n=1 Tax=Phlyctema vagabunda TaxID=108571 RepID=A0ABR4PNX9_9HELO
MFTFAAFHRSQILRNISSVTMQEAKRAPARRHPYRGNNKKPFSSNATPQGNNAGPAAPGPSKPRVATPPLSVPVPLDTPRFADLAKENLIHPIMLQTITEDLKFDHMMPVQAATLHELLANRVDCLAQAKTGTGKTIAFLLPAIQTMIDRKRKPGASVSLLVISPTRELAMQIAKEATALLKRLPEYKVSFAIGGTNKNREEKEILSGCDILIATPGRLLDHLSDDRITNTFRNLDTLVLDEADRLLDMGFMNSLRDIIAKLPDKKATNRQGMLFSATIASHVNKVAHLVLSPNYKFISTIPAGDINTHERVPQHLITVPTFSLVAPALVGSTIAESKLVGAENFKAIIFAPTAALADFYGEILENYPGISGVSVLHSRVSQTKRTNLTNAFREAKNGILVATDVVARGMDFPGVTTVIQVGAPVDNQSYIHRLGRTARAGAEGRGVFIVTQPETFFPRYNLKDINFVGEASDVSSAPAVLKIAERMTDQQKAKTYQAWLGYYKNHLKGMKWDNEYLVQQANIFAREGLGAAETPGLPKSTVGKMGLKGVEGLVIIPGEAKAKAKGSPAHVVRGSAGHRYGVVRKPIERRE